MSTGTPKDITGNLRYKETRKDSFTPD